MTDTNDVWDLYSIEVIHMEMMRLFRSLESFPGIEDNFPDLLDQTYALKEKVNSAFDQYLDNPSVENAVFFEKTHNEVFPEVDRIINLI
jgi:hypothetical protein